MQAPVRRKLSPWREKRYSGVVPNVFNLLQWCFNRLILAQSPHSRVNVSPRMEVPSQGFIPVVITLSAGFRLQIVHSCSSKIPQLFLQDEVQVKLTCVLFGAAPTA